MALFQQQLRRKLLVLVQGCFFNDKIMIRIISVNHSLQILYFGGGGQKGGVPLPKLLNAGKKAYNIQSRRRGMLWIPLAKECQLVGSKRLTVLWSIIPRD